MEGRDMRCAREAGYVVLRVGEALGRLEEVRFALMRSKDAAGCARARTAAVLRRWRVSPAVIGDAQLAVSELVSNAVVHGRDPLDVRLTLMRESLHISVHDGNPLPPRVRTPSPADPSGGRGLRIVAAVSGRWGCAPTPHGKNVWCSLSLAGVRSPA
jgi:anti-sigma regulatory factor (Ser/Thr protein kinase)